MHLIQKNSILLECRTEKFGREAHADISALMNLHFYPKMETLLDRYDQEEKLIAIDLLPVQIVISKDNWKEELLNKSLLEIEKTLAGLIDQPKPSTNQQSGELGSKTLSRKQKLRQLLVNYISTGFLEQNGFVNNLKKLFDEVEVDAVLVKNVLGAMKNDLNIILRFVLNLPHQLQLKINQNAIKNGLVTEGNSLKKWIASATDFDTSDHLREAFQSVLYWVMQLYGPEVSAYDKHLISSLAQHSFKITQERAETLVTDLEAILFSFNEKKNGQSAKDIQKSDDVLRQRSQKEKEKSIRHITQAGLILLHPFLVKLFSDLEYIEKDAFITKEKQHRAVLLLRYLTDFNEEMFENELVLGKLLCGVAVTETVHTDWKITTQEQKYSRDLLTAVIQHWSVLKNTSITTLQTSFLQRPGKLEKRKNESYELTLQQESIDMLLDHLPWGLGIIKTPFMEKYIECLWN